MTGEIDAERLEPLLDALEEAVTAVKRAIVEGEGGDILETADGLWDVLKEVEDVLGTVDFAALPEAIDVEELSETLAEGGSDGTVDLTALREAVNLRKLWRAVDLTDLRAEKQELEAALADVTGGDPQADDGDADDGGLDDAIGEVVDAGSDAVGGLLGGGEGAHVQFDAEARQAFLEEKIMDAIEAFREVLLATHVKLRRLYYANKEKLGQSGYQPDSLNPTAKRTMPPGPIPDSASTRVSTVPAKVRHSRARSPKRIYGRRFLRETETREDKDASAGSGARQTAEGESASAGDDEPTADEDGDDESAAEEDVDDAADDEPTADEDVDDAADDDQTRDSTDDEPVIEVYRDD